MLWGWLPSEQGMWGQDSSLRKVRGEAAKAPAGAGLEASAGRFDGQSRAGERGALQETGMVAGMYEVQGCSVLSVLSPGQEGILGIPGKAGSL